MRHFFFVIGALLAISSGATPLQAASRGPDPIKGHEIFTSKAVYGTTGNCSCNWQWYTIGAKPGTLRLKISMSGAYQKTMAPTFGIRVRLYLGKHFLKFGQTACYATDRHCHGLISETVRVSKRSLYFLQVQGLGADGIGFSTQVLGNIYRIR
ncbi:MAG: hypothetical protein NVSMB52_12030 [Chloroflexota bacterium]